MTSTYDTADAKSATIQRSREIIRSAHWSKDATNFRFTNYCDTNITANNSLDRYKAKVDGEIQVNTLFSGITASAILNPQLLPIKTSIMLDTTERHSISVAVVLFKDLLRKLVILNTEGT